MSEGYGKDWGVSAELGHFTPPVLRCKVGSRVQAMGDVLQIDVVRAEDRLTICLTASSYAARRLGLGAFIVWEVGRP